MLSEVFSSFASLLTVERDGLGLPVLEGLGLGLGPGLGLGLGVRAFATGLGVATLAWIRCRASKSFFDWSCPGVGGVGPLAPDCVGVGGGVVSVLPGAGLPVPVGLGPETGADVGADVGVVVSLGSGLDGLGAVVGEGVGVFVLLLEVEGLGLGVGVLFEEAELFPLELLEELEEELLEPLGGGDGLGGGGGGLGGELAPPTGPVILSLLPIFSSEVPDCSNSRVLTVVGLHQAKMQADFNDFAHINDRGGITIN